MSDSLENSWKDDFASILEATASPEGEIFAVSAQGAAAARAAEHALSTLVCEHVRVSPAPGNVPGARARLDILIRAQAQLVDSLLGEVARRLAGLPISYRLIISCQR
jgi:hypothetical protein